MALLCATAVALLPAAPAQADRIRDDQWHLRYLHVAEAHKLSQGEGVTVAVIDTGVDPHPDLERNLLPGADVYPGGKGDGREDPDGHGTRMAGLIVAHGKGNGRGALGIAPEARLLPIRWKAEGVSSNSDILALGIETAIQKNAKVISMSVGGGPTRRLREAIEKAISADVVLVAAAGNKPMDYGVPFPAFIEGVVAVGAVDRQGKHAEISTTGDKLAISAPGVDILSTSKDGKYATGTGTSSATAIVAGAAALVRSRFPQLSAKEVVHRLTATAVDKGAPGRDEVYGYGVLDLVAALTADVPPLNADPDTTASPTTADPTPEAASDQPENNQTSGINILLITLSTVIVLGIIGGWLVRARR